jgi:hypothetical protein
MAALPTGRSEKFSVGLPVRRMDLESSVILRCAVAAVGPDR